MTIYTVLWTPEARDQLAKLWLDSQERNAITIASAAVDSSLREDASTKGIELSEGIRQLVKFPLVVFFAVNESDRIVEVARCRLAAMRP